MFFHTHHAAVEIVTNWLSDAIKLNFLWRKRAANTCNVSYKRYAMNADGRKTSKTISFEREIKKKCFYDDDYNNFMDSPPS